MKILIIRFSSIGDIVLTSPVIRCLKKQTGCELHFITKSRYASIIQSNPYIDKCWFINEKVSEIIRELKKENFDYVVDLHKNIRSFQVRFGLGKPVLSYNKLTWQKKLMVGFKINRLPDKHIVERYMEAVETLNVQYDGKGLDYFIPEQSFSKMEGFLTENGLYEEKYIALVIGAAHATKKPTVRLLEDLIKDAPFLIVLIGGVEEAETGQLLQESFPSKVTNTCGLLSLNESATLLKKATWVITPDTGMMHIASALNRRICSIWGNTIPEFGMYPLLPQQTPFPPIMMEIKREALPCRPCSTIGKSHCPKGHFKCMEQQSAKRILSFIHRAKV